MTSSKTAYFSSLTGLRFIAASLVFVFHNRKYWRHSVHPEVLRLMNECHVGVSLFFVLSGFLIAYTYYDKPTQSKEKYARYILLRIARIMPLYWILLTAFYLDPDFGKYKFSFQTYSLVHAFSNKYNLTGIAQAWSLNVEMTFYALSPFLCWFLRKKTTYLFAALAALFAATSLTGQLLHHWGNNYSYFYPLQFVSASTFAGRSFQFAAGMLLAKLYLNNQTERISKIHYKTIGGIILSLLTTYCIGLCQKNIYVSGDETTTGLLLHNFILPCGIIMLIAGLMTEESLFKRILSSRMLVLLGNASFTFYLIHISYFNLRLVRFVLLPDRNFILLWILSILIYLLIEKPLYEWFRKIINTTAKKNIMERA